MNSNLPIPGLGQLGSNGTTPVSNLANETPSADSVADAKQDTEMSGIDNIQPDVDAFMTEEEDHKIVHAETVTADSVELQAKDAVEIHDSADAAKAEAETLGNMQDRHERDKGADVAMTPVAQETNGTEMDISGVDNQAQQVAKEGSLPQSPRVTDALEAALDGLLGPAAGTNGNGQSKEHEVSKNDQSQADQPSMADAAAPSEGDGDANPEWEVDSSPYESSSDSSDDSSDDESDVEESRLGIEETARLLMEADGGSDDDLDGAKAAKHAAGVRTKNEQPDEPEPKPDVKLEPEDSIAPLGIVQHVVEGTQAVIEALRDGAAVTILDRGTVLCKEDRTVIGVIHDTIATIHKPMYILKFKSEEESKTAGLERGMQIWYSKQHAVFVFPAQLRREKGSDASNLHDEEVGPDEVEYSDDEQEQAHKREKKSRKRGKGKGNKGDNNDLRSHNANDDSRPRYEEEDDGPYKPLSRPPNFGMGLPLPPPPGVSANPSTNGNRGGHHQGRRGDFRVRGGRGRGRGRGGGGHGQNNHQQPSQPQNNHQPPPPFPTNPPPVPGQWAFPIPHLPQFGGAPPSNPGASNPNYAIPNWGATGQANPYPFPPVPPVSHWSNATPRPPQQANYIAPAGGYSMPPQFPPSNTNAPPAPVPNYQQYSNYYGAGRGQNGRPQHWG